MVVGGGQSQGEAVLEVSSVAGGLELSIEVSSRAPVRMLLPVLRNWLEADGERETGSFSASQAEGVSLRFEPEAELVFPLKPWFTYSPKGEGPESGWRYGLSWSAERKIEVSLSLRD